jgi:hypothetical protein
MINVRWYGAALCIVVTACVTVFSDNARRWSNIGGQIMISKQDRAAQLLRLPDGDYFSFDEDHQVKLQNALAALVNNSNLPGAPLPQPILAIGSPVDISVDQRSSIPVLIGHVQTGLRAWQANFESNLHLFVRNRTTGDLFVADPLLNLRRPRQPPLSGVGKPPNATTAGTVYAGVSLVNLRDKLGDAVTPGQLAVTAVVNELRSNSIAINLRGNEERQSQPPTSTQSYVRYKLERQTTLPTRVVVPAAASVKDGITISVAIQLNADDTIPKGPSGQAFWPFHIILIKLDERPEIIPATIPVQEIGSAGGRHAFNALFDVDVRAAAKSPLSGNYQAYLDVGRELLGPYPLRVSD